MGELPHAAADRQESPGESKTSTAVPLESAPTERIPELHLAVVRYDGGPDRGTIHPPGLTGIERMETWLSANVSAFVELSEWR